MKDCGLARQLSESDRIFSDDLKQATWDTQVDVAPPPAYKIMLVKNLGNTTVREAVEVRDFLSENLMLKGQRGILHLAGLANDSLVFYVSEGNIGTMLQRMQYKKDRMLAEGLVQVTFVKLVHLEVESGHITPDPHVSVVHAYILQGINSYSVSLFPIQICVVARDASKRYAPAHESMGRVLTGSVCDYQPRARTSSSIFILGSETPFYFHLSLDSSPLPVASKHSRPLREAQDLFLGERIATIYPVAEYRYAFGTCTPFATHNKTQL